MDHPWRVVDGMSFVIKFWTDRRYGFGDIAIFKFWQLAWKCLLTPLYRVCFGAHFPEMMSLIFLTPKRTVLGLNHVIWTIKREYRPRGSSWALEREKKTVQVLQARQEKSHKRVIFHLFGRSPWSDLHQKLFGRWRPWRNHVCQVSRWNFQGLRF